MVLILLHTVVSIAPPSKKISPRNGLGLIEVIATEILFHFLGDIRGNSLFVYKNTKRLSIEVSL